MGTVRTHLGKDRAPGPERRAARRQRVEENFLTYKDAPGRQSRSIFPPRPPARPRPPRPTTLRLERGGKRVGNHLVDLAPAPAVPSHAFARDHKLPAAALLWHLLPLPPRTAPAGARPPQHCTQGEVEFAHSASRGSGAGPHTPVVWGPEAQPKAISRYPPPRGAAAADVWLQNDRI